MKCSFCNVELEKGTGKMFIRKTGKIFYFCSSKCEKNLISLGRKPKVGKAEVFEKVAEE